MHPAKFVKALAKTLAAKQIRLRPLGGYEVCLVCACVAVYMGRGREVPTRSVSSAIR